VDNSAIDKKHPEHLDFKLREKVEQRLAGAGLAA